MLFIHVTQCVKHLMGVKCLILRSVKTFQPAQARPSASRHLPCLRGHPRGTWYVQEKHAPCSGRAARRTRSHKGITQNTTYTKLSSLRETLPLQVPLPRHKTYTHRNLRVQAQRRSNPSSHTLTNAAAKLQEWGRELRQPWQPPSRASCWSGGQRSSTGRSP